MRGHVVVHGNDTQPGSRPFPFLPFVRHRFPPRTGAGGPMAGKPMEASAVTIRPLHQRDENLHRAFYQRLHGDDLRLRFGRAVPQVTDRELAWLTAMSPGEVVLGAFQRRRRWTAAEIVGIGRAVPIPETRSAELAITVRSDLKRRGIGTALLIRLIEECRARDIDDLVGDVLHENEAMLALARKLGATVDGATRCDYARIRFAVSGQAPPVKPATAHRWFGLGWLRGTASAGHGTHAST